MLSSKDAGMEDEDFYVRYYVGHKERSFLGNGYG